MKTISGNKEIFEVGDFVRCINDFGTNSKLVKNTIYQIKKINDGGNDWPDEIWLTDEIAHINRAGNLVAWYGDRFEFVE